MIFRLSNAARSYRRSQVFVHLTVLLTHHSPLTIHNSPFTTHNLSLPLKNAMRSYRRSQVFVHNDCAYICMQFYVFKEIITG